MGVGSVSTTTTNPLMQSIGQAGVTPQQLQLTNQQGQALDQLALSLIQALKGATTSSTTTANPSTAGGLQAMQYATQDGPVNPTTDSEGQDIQKHHVKEDDSGYWEALGYDDSDDI